MGLNIGIILLILPGMPCKCTHVGLLPLPLLLFLCFCNSGKFHYILTIRSILLVLVLSSATPLILHCYLSSVFYICIIRIFSWFGIFIFFLGTFRGLLASVLWIQFSILLSLEIYGFLCIFKFHLYCCGVFFSFFVVSNSLFGGILLASASHLVISLCQSTVWKHHFSASESRFQFCWDHGPMYHLNFTRFYYSFDVSCNQSVPGDPDELGSTSSIGPVGSPVMHMRFPQDPGGHSSLQFASPALLALIYFFCVMLVLFSAYGLLSPQGCWTSTLHLRLPLTLCPPPICSNSPSSGSCSDLFSSFRSPDLLGYA